MPKKYTFKTIDSRKSTNCELGAIYTEKKTEFRVWAPIADNVQLNLWQSTAKKVYRMQSGRHGVWYVEIMGDLHGAYYTYTVTTAGSAKETIDIYAKASNSNGKRGLIFNPKYAEIDGWKSEAPIKLDKSTDAVLYELHIRDFSMDPNANFINRGKFAAFCENYVTNTNGDIIGLDYIASLGVTHIHLLPVMDFASVDELNPRFNWGYDPQNYNIPEGSYSLYPNDGIERIKELRRLVAAVHKKGMGVVLDVVYNHTFDAEASPFGCTFPHYYYRHINDTYSNGSGCGNEVATERVMTSRYIRDSLCYIAETFKIDGFRFDLMGLIDINTLNECAAELRKINPDILLYGEGWTGGLSPLDDNKRAMKHNATKVPQYAMFSDDIRDAIKGSVFNDIDIGYVNGCADEQHRERIKSALVGGIYHPQINRPCSDCWTDTPSKVINYVEAHDNLTLYDKLILSMPDSTEAQRIAANKMSAALVILAQGIPFLQAGQEILRSKPLGDGKFDHNSYKSNDSVNCIKWDDVTNNYSIAEYYRGLIAIRRKFPQLHMTNGDEIRSAVSFRNLTGGAFVMYNKGIALIVNPSDRPKQIKLGEFTVYANADIAAAIPISHGNGNAVAKPHSILFAVIKQHTPQN